MASTAKRMSVVVIILLILFGGIFGWDGVRAYFIGQYFKHFTPPAATISSAEATTQNVQAKLMAIGSIVAVNGVNISTQVSGVVTQIAFSSGQMVKQGQLLVALD